MISLINNGRYRINRQKLITQINTYLSKKNVDKNTCFSIIFVGRRKMKYITNKYKKEMDTLPVLSFPYSDIPEMSEYKDYPRGEIFICYPLAVLLAAEQDTTVDAMIAELSIHGLSTMI